MGTPPPTVPQTTLEIETETPPQLQTNPMVAASSPFAVIQEHYRRFLRFACMEVVRAIIGLSVGALLVCAFESSYYFSLNPFYLKLIDRVFFFRHIFSWRTRNNSLLVEWECPSLTVDQLFSSIVFYFPYALVSVFSFHVFFLSSCNFNFSYIWRWGFGNLSISIVLFSKLFIYNDAAKQYATISLALHLSNLHGTSKWITSRLQINGCIWYRLQLLVPYLISCLHFSPITRKINILVPLVLLRLSNWSFPLVF